MRTDCILQKKSDKGLIRNKNEDRVEVLYHPADPDIKLLAVADGMGGRRYGEIASSFVIDKLCYWFCSLSSDILNQTVTVVDLLRIEIDKWNEELIFNYGENCLGTTLTLALVNKTKTIILNIGDSRCYIYKDKNLLQVTDDDSNVWLYYKKGQVEKDDLRYFSTSNIINACIGLNRELCKVKSIILDNNNYELLLLVTDGITDLLTDEKIKFLINNNRKDQILDNIVKEAVYVDQDLCIPSRLKRRYFESFYVPSHGKDNASAAIFIKN